MKKKFFAYMIIGILLFTFLAQGKGTKTYWFQIASQGEGESGFLTNSNLNQKKVYLTFDDGPSDHTAQILDILKEIKQSKKNYLLFSRYMEALIAFHRYYGGRDE